jgi:DNA (cytosine-5)-methyltransferase 1
MTFASLCTGIGGFDLGLEQAGMTPLWFCEINKPCQQVLKHHWPNVPCYDDMTALPISELPRPDVLAMGTPCQGFSVAGLRASLQDCRSNLCLAGVIIANELRPKRIIFENVPGILSTPDNAFGCFLAAMVGADAPLVPPRAIRGWRTVKSWPDCTDECERDGETGERFCQHRCVETEAFKWTNEGMVAGRLRCAAWRTLDSQFFGLAQRRKRVFLVADSGDGSCGQILFERKGRDWHPPERGEKGQEIAPCLAARTRGGGGLGTDAECGGGLSPPLMASGRGTERTGESRGQDCVIPELSQCLSGDGIRRPGCQADDCKILIPEIAACHNARAGDKDETLLKEVTAFGHAAHSLDSTGGDAICYRIQDQNSGKSIKAIPSDVASTLDTRNLSTYEGSFNCDVIQTKWRVRRLTPVECARLSGFPDDFNAMLSDSQRYKQFGNCVNVPVSRWIGERIMAYEKRKTT